MGAGPDEPVADNKTKEGQARNRRVEIDIKAPGAEVESGKVETSTTENSAPAQGQVAKATGMGVTSTGSARAHGGGNTSNRSSVG